MALVVLDDGEGRTSLHQHYFSFALLQLHFLMNTLRVSFSTCERRLLAVVLKQLERLI
jgi:hypothetical protein